MHQLVLAGWGGGITYHLTITHFINHCLLQVCLLCGNRMICFIENVFTNVLQYINQYSTINKYTCNYICVMATYVGHGSIQNVLSVNIRRTDDDDDDDDLKVHMRDIFWAG